MRKIRILIVGIVALAIIGSAGYYFFGRKSEANATPAGQVTRIVKVTKGDLTLNVSADGVVQPINRVEIKSKASGQIEQLNFVEGQFVEKGELLLVLDQTTAKNDHEQAKADLALQEASAKQAENNYKRSVELFEKKLISEQERDQVNVELVRARSLLVKSRASLSSAEERLRDTRIIAPVSGIVLTKSVELGQIISSGVSNVGGGTLIATIADMEMVHVETNVDEVDIGKIRVEQKATIRADAFPEDRFTGGVVRISPMGKSQQNVTTFNVVVLVRNVGGRLKAGMSASVDLEILDRKQVILAPNEALKDPRSEQGRAMLATGKKPEEESGTAKSDTSKGSSVDVELAKLSFDELRKRLENASEDERQKLRGLMRERIQKMSSEERQKFFAQMSQQSGGQGGSGGGMMMFGSGGGGNSGPRQQRTSQVSNENQVRDRVVLVKEGNAYVPRIVKAGPSNFDNTEIIEGLQEGDELQIITISRAKIQSAEFTERMRSMQGVGGVGGMSGGGGRR